MAQLDVTTSGAHLADALVTPTGGGADKKLSDVAAEAAGNHTHSGLVSDSRQVSTTHSLTGGGDLSGNRTLSLVNDSATPGNNTVYGVNSAGVRGWKPDPSGTPGDISGMPTVGTMTALRDADTALGAVYVRGYSTAGDGGEGVFQWNPSSTQTECMGLVVAPTGGGTGRWVRSITNDVYDVRWVGARGDGTTNNATALSALRLYLMQYPARLYEIYFPRGDYIWNNNRWLHGLKRIRLRGDGDESQIRCSYFAGGTHNMNTQWIRMTPPFHKEAFDELTPNNWTNGDHLDGGDLIQTTAISSRQVTLSNVANATKYAPDNLVFLTGYEQQLDDWPPNHRENMWSEVESVNTSTGVITLKWPLDRVFRSDWHEANYGGVFPHGKSRIINLDDGRHYFHYFEVKDLYIKNNEHSSYTSIMQVCCRVGKIENVTARPYFSPRYTETLYVKNSRFYPNRNSEVDKGNGTMLFDRCEFRHGQTENNVVAMTAAITTEKLYMKNCMLYGTVGVSPKELHLEGNNIVNQRATAFLLGRYSQSYPSRRWTVLNNNFVSSVGLEYIFENLSGYKSFTPTSIGGNNELIYNMSGGSGWQSVHQQADVGTFISTQDGTKMGRITALRQSGTDYIVETDMKSPATVTTYYWAPYSYCRFEGNSFTTDRPKLTVRHWAQMNNGPGELDIARMNFGREIRLNDGLWGGWDDSNCQAWVHRIVVQVNKPYTGTDTTARLAMKRLGVERFIGYVNLLATGRREITENGVTGAQTGDDFNVSAQDAATTLKGWFHQFRIRPERQSGQYGLTGAESTMPDGYLEVHFMRPA